MLPLNLSSMATFPHLQVPIGATRLREEKGKTSSEFKPPHKVTVSLPPPSSPSTTPLRPSLLSTAASTVSSPTTAATSAVSMIPQLLLSTSLSPMTPSASGFNPRKRLDPHAPILLSSKDPLSLPILTSNFKRFVMAVGPVFWLQDRIEEVVFWKRGWMWTTIWMAGYALLCGRNFYQERQGLN